MATYYDLYAYLDKLRDAGYRAHTVRKDTYSNNLGSRLVHVKIRVRQDINAQ